MKSKPKKNPIPEPKVADIDGLKVVDCTGGELEKLPKDVAAGFAGLLRGILRNVSPPIHLGETVTIVNTGLKGVVRGVWLSIDTKGPAYDVRYADRNGLSTSHWFQRDELATAEDLKAKGPKAPAKKKPAQKAKAKTPTKEAK